MLSINMHDAKTNLSKYVAELDPGETIVLCNRNQPVAEIRAIGQRKTKRRIGVAKGEFKVPKSFFEPLPEELLKAFSGE